MPRRHREAKLRVSEIDQDQYFALLLGDSDGERSQFASPAARHEAWLANPESTCVQQLGGALERKGAVMT